MNVWKIQMWKDRGKLKVASLGLSIKDGCLLFGSLFKHKVLLVSLYFLRDWRKKGHLNTLNMNTWGRGEFSFLSLFTFRAAPVAYGSSQAKGQIGAAAAGYTTATAMPDPSHFCNLHHSSWQCRILNPLSKAKDWTCIFMGASQIHFWLAANGSSCFSFCFMKAVGHRSQSPGLAPGGVGRGV